MTFKQLATMLRQIEAGLNSGSLCSFTDEPNDLALSTPAHFLIGDSLLAPPDVSTKDVPLSTQFMDGKRNWRSKF